MPLPKIPLRQFSVLKRWRVAFYSRADISNTSVKTFSTDNCTAPMLETGPPLQTVSRTACLWLNFSSSICPLLPNSWHLQSQMISVFMRKRNSPGVPWNSVSKGRPSTLADCTEDCSSDELRAAQPGLDSASRSVSGCECFRESWTSSPSSRQGYKLHRKPWW